MLKTILLISILTISTQMFSQNIKVIYKVDDFTGDTLKQTKRWYKVAGTSLVDYFKVKAKSVNNEKLIGFAIGAKYITFSIERGANVLFKMSDDEIIPISIDEPKESMVGNAFGTELIMYVSIEGKAYRELTGPKTIKAIRVVTNKGPINWKVPKENSEIIKKVLTSLD